MKAQGTIKKGILIVGIILLTIVASHAGGDKTKKITSKKFVVLIEHLNQLITVVDELELVIENWMIEENYLPEVTIIDSELSIEIWMLDQSNYLSSENDEELVLESWMNDTNYISDSNIEDEELEIEDWMLY